MRVLHSIGFPDPAISWAGLGADPDLCWWITAGGSADDRSVRVARRQGGVLAVLGTVAPVGRRVVVRITHDGGMMLVVTPETLHRVPLGRAGNGVTEFPLHDESVTALDSHDGRVVFLARALAWPPIRRLDTETGEIETLEPQRDEASKHHPLLALSPDGRQLAFGHVFDAIEVFDLASGTSAPWPQSSAESPVVKLRDSDMLAHLRFTVDGGHLFVVSHPRAEPPGPPHLLRIGDVNGKDVHDHALAHHLPTVGVARGGRVIAAPRRGATNLVDVFDAVSGKVLDSTDVGHHVMALNLDWESGRLTVAHPGGVTVLALETS